MPILFLVTLVVGLPAGAPSDDAAIPGEVLARLKAATVRVLVQDERSKASGSGFVLETEAGSVFVATNEHVIHGSEAGAARVRVVFQSGTGGERTLTAEVAASDRRHDLAILKVLGNQVPPLPIELGIAIEPYETMQVYILGFPLGNPKLSVGKGAISSFTKGPRGNVTSVRLDGELQPGNSGGPVVDEAGRIVGVATAAILRADRIGFAIPVAELKSMLNGRIADVVVSAQGEADGHILLESSVRAIDPLNRIKDITAVLVPAATVAGPIRPDAKGNWPSLPSARAQTLSLRDSPGKGALAPGRGRLLQAQTRHTVATQSDRDLLLQVSYRTASGAKVFHAPVPYRIPVALEPGQKLNGWAEVFDSNKTSQFSLGWDVLTIAPLPAPQGPVLQKRRYVPGQDQGPSVLGRLQGDFVARVRVEMRRSPDPVLTQPAARAASQELAGAGLWLWRDRLALRLQRVAIRRGETVLDAIVLDPFGIAGVRGNQKHVREIPDVPVELRLERKGSTLIASYTLDDGTTESLPALVLDFGGEWQLGVKVLHAIDHPCEVRFEGFEVSIEDPGRPELRIDKHTRPAGGLAVSADGQRAASFANWMYTHPILARSSRDQPDNTARVWNLRTGKELFNRPARSFFVTAGALSPDGRSLVTGETEGWLRLWDVNSTQLLRQVKQSSGPVVALALSADARLMLTGEARSFYLRGSGDFSELRRFDDGAIKQDIAILAFTPDGRRALSGHQDGTVIEWDLASGRRLRSIEPPARGGPVLAFSTDGTRALHAASQLLLWGLEGGELVRAFDLPRGAISAAAISPDGRLVLCAPGASPAGELPQPMTAARLPPTAARLPPDTRLTIWDVATGAKLRAFSAVDGEVTGMVVTADSRKVLVAGVDRSLRLWPLPEPGAQPVDWRVVRRFHDPNSGELGRVLGNARGASRPASLAP